jgi:2-phospho-L-lactate/phosphoenolpyruvate guanylyltransferase
VPPPQWTLIVPVKQTAIAKSRLAALGDSVRRRLAVAFACDAVAAALRCSVVDEVVVVSNDELAGGALARLGAHVIPDVPDAGLNPALVSAAVAVRRRAAHAHVAVMSADLPAVRASDLQAALAAAPASRWFVPDRAGDGTTMLGASSPYDLDPAFGPGSGAAHRAGGAVEVAGPDLVRLRLDVDTAADLDAAVELGVGDATAAVLASIGWSVRPPTRRAV